MNKIVKDALILTAITVIAGAALGLVKEVTEPYIKLADEAATQRAYKAVFESADSFEDVTVPSVDFADGSILAVVSAKNSSGEALGYVVKVSTKAGYGSDPIVISVGITNDMMINGYSITSISETPGLGMRSTETGEGSFASQFVNRAAAKFSVVKGESSSASEISAISGATITSKAVTGAVNAAVATVESLGGGR